MSPIFWKCTQPEEPLLRAQTLRFQAVFSSGMHVLDVVWYYCTKKFRLVGSVKEEEYSTWIFVTTVSRNEGVVDRVIERRDGLLS